MKTVTIMQPAYLPWCGYFDRIDKSDLFVVLDDVAMDANSKTKFCNRNKIRTKEGWQWLTVPLKKHRGTNISEIKCAENPWRDKHIRALEFAYGKTGYISDIESSIKSSDRLTDITNSLLGKFYKWLDIRVPYTFSSLIRYRSGMDRNATGSEKILNICRHFEADRYLSGPFGRDYLDRKSFEDAGIEIEFHDYEHPEYKQKYDPFIPYMSALDVLMNHGEKAMEIIRT